MTGWGGGDCGFDFVTGKEYLVYADQDNQGNLETGICSSTKLLEDAGPELRILRGEPASAEDLLSRETYYNRVSSKARVSLCGKVADTSGKPLNDASLKLIPIRDDPFPGEGDETKSDMNGSFCFKGVDSGKFLLAAEVNDHNQTTFKGFYPSVSKRSDAGAIEVEAGNKLNGLNFILHDQPVHTLRFRIVNAINLPMPANLQVMFVDSVNPAKTTTTKQVLWLLTAQPYLNRSLRGTTSLQFFLIRMTMIQQRFQSSFDGNQLEKKST
jgi:hypothetical protein